MQSQHIKERIAQFGGKLYLEFGGKLYDDNHASRVLPGFQPDSKLRMPPTPWQKFEAVRPRMPRCRSRCTKPNGNCPKLQITGCVF